ncbi:MAG: hypothetical protein KAW92_09650 [Candidatus Cloacimonetes bacterium]|nr:hypothetical protein [Candidatus Cloacimonadota bacterium]
MDNQEKLKKLKAEVEEFKSEKIRKEEQLKGLRQQRNDLITQIKDLGYTPENLSSEIKKLEDSINSQLSEIETKLSKGIVNEE